MSKRKKIRRRVRYSLLYRFVQFLIFISNAIPRKAWLRFCGWLGRIAYHFTRKARGRMTEHIAFAYGDEMSPVEIRKLVRRVYEYMGMNTGEMMRATQVHTLSQLHAFVKVNGQDNFDRAYAKGKGVLFIASHLGAFELQVSSIALRGLRPRIVGTPLKDERLHEMLWGYRNRHGAVAMVRGKETFTMLKALKSGGILALLIDQDTKVKSRFVNFFSKPAATPVGAAILAMKTGAAVIPTYIYLGQDWKQHMHMLPEVRLRNTGDEEADMVYNTQLLTNIIEKAIREHPEQWVWMHRRWRTQPGQEIR
jgi:KDO2-lipid IV(A) lauroyltransferase